MYIVLITSGTKDVVEKASIRVFDDSFKVSDCIDSLRGSYLDGSWKNVQEVAAEQDIFPLIVVPKWTKGV